jgi:hypothetical protein
MATSPGHDGRPNEDFLGAVPSAVVMLDGAGIPGTEALCHHGVAWYSHNLGALLLARLACDGGIDLAAALADSIDQIAAQHRDTCEIANPSSPQATVAVFRVAESRADFLVLADAFVVLDQVAAGPEVVTDPREVEVRRESLLPLRGLPMETAEYEQAHRSAIEVFRARRNQPGGYWIAKDDPRAAAEAVTGSVPLARLRGAAILSNGASRIVDPYRLAEWPAALELLRASGPDAFLRRIREAEAGAGAAGALPGFQASDDASVAYCDVSP